MKKNYKKGIALFIAMIAVSALLIITASISDIAYKQQIISYAGRDSKIASYAADAGAECALFYDLKGGGGTVDPADSFRFATGQGADDSSVTPDFECNDNNTNAHTSPFDGVAITTTFYFNVSDPDDVQGDESTVPRACAIVEVEKTLVVGGGINTEIRSRGYNNLCDIVGPTSDPQLETTSIRNLERSFQINY